MMRIVFVFGLSALICGVCVAEGGSAVKTLDIALAGDLLGHIVGTVSTDEGAQPVVGAEVTVSGRNPSGPWRHTAQSGENGLWQVDLPLGTQGAVEVAAVSASGTGHARVDAADVAKRLTPRPKAGSRRISLDGKWDFAIDPPATFPSGAANINWASIDTPSHWEMKGFVAESGRAAYRKIVTVPAEWAGKRIKLRADGIYSRAEIWVNGHRVGGHVGVVPFELDISDAAKFGEANEIAVLVTDHSFASEIDRMSFYAYWNLAGIWRPIEVFCVEPAHVSRLAVSTDFDENYRDADLLVDVDVSNEQGREVKDAALNLSVRDPHGKRIALPELAAKVTLGPWEMRRISLKTRVTAPEQWNAESPRLYTMTADIAVPGQRSAPIEQRFGFKEVEIKDRTYLVNGRPVKFWGTNRLDAHPLTGRAVTPDIVKRDLELMKGCNINAIRTSHFPTHPAVLDVADEMGFYVEDEAPFIWVSAGSTGMFGPDKPYASDLRYAPFFIYVTSAMVERDRNHPCVSIWSLCNESAFGNNFHINWDWVRKSDPTRPCSAGQSGNLDIATYHNPTSMQRLADTAGLPMPVLYDEGMAIFHGWGLSAGLELDPGLHDYWVTAHLQPRDGIYAKDNQLGVMIWAWVDDQALVPGREMRYWRAWHPRMTFADSIYKMPGRGIVGDYCWGTVDGWRRPRPEWWLTKKLYSPILVPEKPLALPGPGKPVLVPVENRSVFTNLKDFACKWRIGAQGGEVRADVGPHSSGEIQIPVRAPKPDDALTLEFFNVAGLMIDAYNLTFKARELPKAAWSGHPARVIEEPVKYLSGASPIRLVGKGCEIAYDRSTGGLLKATAGGELVLILGPSLHVMNNAEPAQTSPAGWQFQGAEVDSDGVLNWKGAYGSEFAGGFRIKMDDAGDAVIDYSFTYSGPERCSREIGLEFELPLGFDCLDWDRRAEWSYYPADHIGRPRGVAHAHPGVPQTVPPGDRPFAADDHPWGCNDFRSTKRNAYTASLTSAAGAGIEVISDGTQHVRATVGVDSILLKVLDYYGGSATGINEYDGAYGAGRTLKPGDVVKGEIKLRLLPPGRQSRHGRAQATAH